MPHPKIGNTGQKKLLLSLVQAPIFVAGVAGSALLLCLVPAARPGTSRHGDKQDLAAIAFLYVAVVALLRLAFVGFTTDHVAGLFLAFAAALLLGVAGPIYYTVWMRERPLRDLGLSRDNWRSSAVLALLFAGFADVLALMAATIWQAHRHLRKGHTPTSHGPVLAIPGR